MSSTLLLRVGCSAAAHGLRVRCKVGSQSSFIGSRATMEKSETWRWRCGPCWLGAVWRWAGRGQTVRLPLRVVVAAGKVHSGRWAPSRCAPGAAPCRAPRAGLLGAQAKFNFHLQCNPNRQVPDPTAKLPAQQTDPGLGHRPRKTPPNTTKTITGHSHPHVSTAKSRFPARRQMQEGLRGLRVGDGVGGCAPDLSSFPSDLRPLTDFAPTNSVPIPANLTLAPCRCRPETTGLRQRGVAG